MSKATQIGRQRQAVKRIKRAIKRVVYSSFIDEASTHLDDALTTAGACFTSAKSYVRGESFPQAYTQRIVTRLAVDYQAAAEHCNRRDISTLYCEVEGCGQLLPANFMLRREDRGRGPQICCPHCAENEAYSANWQRLRFTWAEPVRSDDPSGGRYQNGYLMDAASSPIRAFVRNHIAAEGEVVKPKTRLFGFEIECNIPYVDQAVIKLSETEMAKNIAIMKSDGSLGYNGMEVCTLPMTKAAAMTALKTVSDALLNVNARAWNRSQCGLHIHVSAASASWVTWGKVERFFRNSANQNLIDLVAGRKANQYCQRPVSYRITTHKITDAKKKAATGDRYQAINFATRKPTVEFRLFRGNVSYDGLVRCMEFCDSAIEWAATESNLSPMHSLAYVQWLYQHRSKYPLLVKYLRRGELQVEEAA